MDHKILTKNEAITMYKGFNPDMTCKGFQYEVGKSYHEDGITICHRGFHCSRDILNIPYGSNYFTDLSIPYRLCRVKVWGAIIENNNQICASDIEILEDITDEIPKIIEYAISLLNKLPADIYTYFNIPIEVTRKLKDRLDWEFMSMYQVLSEDYIREFSNKVIWRSISHYQKLSENFIREFQDKVDWRRISRVQKLSEDFIREFQDKVDWNCISHYQKLSEDFIREFQDKVDWREISHIKLCHI